MQNEYRTGVVCVYHDHCPDGITAFWVVKNYFSNPTQYPANYDKPPELDILRGRDVVIVDFCWSLEQMRAVAAVAKTVLVLDHHTTSELTIKHLIGAAPNVRGFWDNTRSGAGIAWDWFNGGNRPALIDYVEDRDLWRWKLPESREVSAACSLLSLSIEDREILMATPIGELRAKGAIVLEHQKQLVSQASYYRPRRVIGGHIVPCVPCQIPALCSEVGHALAKGEPFSATYQVRTDGTAKVSLRSNPEGVDVSEVAKQYGGGGHRNAAGFSIGSIEMLEFVAPEAEKSSPEAAQ